MVAKCPNCKGPHFAQANACKAKGGARALARGWRSPSPTRKGKGAQAPDAPEDKTNNALATGGEMEVETEVGSGGGAEGAEDGGGAMEE